jgi:hypothetical protein
VDTQSRSRCRGASGEAPSAGTTRNSPYFGQPSDYPHEGDNPATFNPARLKGVLELVAERSGWRRPAPRGRSRGIAAHFTFGSYAAHVAEVSVEGSRLRVHCVVSAIDVGIPVNPLNLEAQTQGGIIDGLSAAMFGEITIDSGTIQSTFEDYPLLRQRDAPEIEVHIVRSRERPTGFGEIALPPIAPPWRMRSVRPRVGGFDACRLGRPVVVVTGREGPEGLNVRRGNPESRHPSSAESPPSPPVVRECGRRRPAAGAAPGSSTRPALPCPAPPARPAQKESGRVSSANRDSGKHIRAAIAGQAPRKASFAVAMGILVSLRRVLVPPA